MKVQVMTSNSVQVSSKSELSSGTFDHVKVCNHSERMTITGSYRNFGVATTAYVVVARHH